VFAASSDSDQHATNYYLGSVVNTGKDNGYSENNDIELKDPHYGWTLGRFFISGFTRVQEDAGSNPVFLKTLGDTVALWFVLDQDIEKLNDDEKLSISDDNNGYDMYFGIKKSDFGRGTLIVRKTDYNNLSHDPIVYYDYLDAKSVGADTKVELFEEGDYEVALDYEIKKAGVSAFGKDITNTYTNYRIRFSFSVRNGNCMVYPFDVATKAELTNTSITESGFYLDLAKSRYLDIDIKKEVLAEGAEGLSEDVRFNTPTKDGNEYTQEGIYTITVSNRYTNEKTTKIIYVGTNNILKAHVTTGLPIKEINEEIARGGQVTEDGLLIKVSDNTVAESSSEIIPEDKPDNQLEMPPDTETGVTLPILVIVAIAVIAVVIIVSIIVVSRKRKVQEQNVYESENKSESEGVDQ
jgi:hypothetical protein